MIMGRRKSKFKLGKRQNGKESLKAVASSSSPPWIELPCDVTANILRRLGTNEILEVAENVCSTWRRICHDPSMWRVLCLKSSLWWNEEHVKLFREAVDRSQGQLVDLTISCVGDDELMDYIADRTSHLRSLRIDNCYELDGEALAKAVKKNPHLEELHLINTPLILPADVEVIGNSCPMLKTFFFKEHGLLDVLPPYVEEGEPMSEFGYNDYALAIAKTMPNLHQLQLIAHFMKNEGLEAILDGCPQLESLDIRRCIYLDLEGALGKRCSEQIKDLKLPNDSISDIWWIPCYDPLYDSGYSDLYTEDCFYEYDDFEQYDDYASPFGIGFFGDNATWFCDD